MSRIVELLIALNALGGIATYLGFRLRGRRNRDRSSSPPEALPPEREDDK